MSYTVTQEIMLFMSKLEMVPRYWYTYHTHLAMCEGAHWRYCSRVSLYGIHIKGCPFFERSCDCKEANYTILTKTFGSKRSGIKFLTVG